MGIWLLKLRRVRRFKIPCNAVLPSLSEFLGFHTTQDLPARDLQFVAEDGAHDPAESGGARYFSHDYYALGIYCPVHGNHIHEFRVFRESRAFLRGSMLRFARWKDLKHVTLSRVSNSDRRQLRITEVI